MSDCKILHSLTAFIAMLTVVLEKTTTPKARLEVAREIEAAQLARQFFEKYDN